MRTIDKIHYLQFMTILSQFDQLTIVIRLLYLGTVASVTRVNPGNENCISLGADIARALKDASVIKFD